MASRFNDNRHGSKQGRPARESAPVSGAARTTPFGLSVEMLKGVFRTLRAFVEGDRVPHCFNDSEIYRIFFKFGRVNDVRYNLEGLSLDSIVEVFNPREGLVDSDFLGGDINMQMELICWFMGFVVPGRSWFPASSFKESVGGSAESVEIFDLKGSIYKTLKHRFNQAIGRAGRDSCITLRHNFARMEHGGVFFDTAVSLKMDRAELQEEHIATTIGNITSRIMQAESVKTEMDNTEYTQYRGRKVSAYQLLVRKFSEKVRAAAARRGFVMTPLSDLMVSVYADMCFDAIYHGFTVLEDDARVNFTEQDIEEDMYKTMGCKAVGGQVFLTKSQFLPAEAVEIMAAAGARLEHMAAVKMGQEMVAAGGGGGGGKWRA
jgi:hypothetical protein